MQSQKKNDKCFGLFGVPAPKPVTTAAVKSLVDYDFDGCVMCGDDLWKYKCPACESKTCSLQCCKEHKFEFDCSGIRNRIPFKRMVDFDQSQFLDDYFFLDDTERTIDALRRDKKQIVKSLDTLPPWLRKLLYESKIRGIRLKLLPAGFQRRVNNKTTFMYAQKMIHWDIEFILTHCIDQRNSSTTTFTDHRVAENVSIAKVVEKFVKPNSDDEWNKKYALYQSAGFKGICVLLKLECKKYCEIDLTNTVREALTGKTIVEFPCLIVTLKDNKYSFDVIDDDLVVANEIEFREKSHKRLKTYEEESKRAENSDESLRPYGPLPLDYYDNIQFNNS